MHPTVCKYFAVRIMWAAAAASASASESAADAGQRCVQSSEKSMYIELLG